MDNNDNKFKVEKLFMLHIVNVCKVETVVL